MCNNLGIIVVQYTARPLWNYPALYIRVLCFESPLITTVKGPTPALLHRITTRVFSFPGDIHRTIFCSNYEGPIAH